MGFDLKAILNFILQILEQGKSLGLFDKDGNPISTSSELETHLINRLADIKEEGPSEL